METKAKPGGYVPKGRRGLAGKKAAEAAVQTVTSADNRHVVGMVASAPTETQTQIANRLFRERAEKIADAEVTIQAGENEWEPVFLILVPELRSEAARKIIKLRGDLYRKYPESNLNVEIRGRRELSECPISYILIS